LFVHICFIDANAQFIEELPTNLEHTSSLSIFRGVRQSEAVNKRTDNVTTKGKRDKQTNNDRQNTTQKTKD
jgi:hypothetical protein